MADGLFHPGNHLHGQNVVQKLRVKIGIHRSRCLFFSENIENGFVATKLNGHKSVDLSLLTYAGIKTLRKFRRDVLVYETDLRGVTH